MSLPFSRTSSDAFLRFVVGTDGEDTDGLDGPFVMCRLLRDHELLEPYEADWLEQVYDWFNAELPCPPFVRCQFPVDAVSWYRTSATRFVARMWDLAALLREHGQPVRILKTDRPGAILYQDDYQVVAEPFRLRYRRARRDRELRRRRLACR